MSVGTSSSLALPPLPRLDAPEALRSSHGFSGTANWLIPGRILLGANPTKGRGSALDRLMPIRCDAGCGTFVSLQEENEGREEEYLTDAASVADPAPDFIRFPIEDLRPAPSLAFLNEACEEIARRVRAGERVYLHCFAGRGRTGLVACCLLGVLYEEVADADEALERVGAYYRLRAGYDVASSRAQDGRSPETEPQRQQVRDFLAR